MNRSNHACEHGLWHLHLWHPGNPLKTQMRVPFRCRSWRHAGPCREWKGAQDYVRVAEAISQHSDWNYLVLTFAQRDWESEWQQAKAGVLCWSKLRKRMVREFGTLRYIQTWERHARRGFHVNLAISSAAVSHALDKLTRASRWPWLRAHCVACGFGWKHWAEPMRAGGAAMAGYMTKLSRELTGAGPKSQVPTQAPPHFRRLRTSQGLLPPIHVGDYTGHLVQSPVQSFLR